MTNLTPPTPLAIPLTIPPLLSAFEHAIEPTRQSFIAITTKPTDYTLPEESKFGGLPYWPEGVPYPQFKKHPAKLMAQINFSELSSHGLTMPDFPTTGLLQFFFEHKDDMWGINFDDITKSNVKVVYHPSTSSPTTDDLMVLKVANDDDDMPFEGCLALSFEKKEEFAGFTDLVASDNFYSSIEGDLTEEQQEIFYDQINNSGSKIGGYAAFTQDDPRELGVDWVMLLQMDTDENLMFGDAGVANWFIKREDLKNLNFDNVLFTWDCC